MESPGFIRKIRHQVEDENHWLTRQKLLAFGGTLIVIGISMGAFESGEAPRLNTQLVELPLPARLANGTADTASATASPAPAIPMPGDGWEKVVVRSGQTLDAIFRQQGFKLSLLHEILALNDDTRGLTKIRPGETFEFRTGAGGEFLQMRYPLDEAHYLLVSNDQETLQAELQQRQITSKILEADGVIQTSLFMAARESGLSDAMIMRLANIFGWDIDFVLDIRAGDRFMLVYEKLYRDGEFLRAVWFEGSGNVE